jgi:uncharacterized membrane protein
MSSDPSANALPAAGSPQRPDHRLRFHAPHLHLASAFGGDWFGRRAESFARFFGTPVFLIAQTVLVAIWIAFNVWGIAHFDLYPFILLNLAFSTQAAYAAPLILLAQTRQADRDKALSEADAQHREALAAASSERQELAARQQELIVRLLEQNTELTRATQELTLRVQELTRDIHNRTCQDPSHGTA